MGFAATTGRLLLAAGAAALAAWLFGGGVAGWAAARNACAVRKAEGSGHGLDPACMMRVLQVWAFAWLLGAAALMAAGAVLCLAARRTFLPDGAVALGSSWGGRLVVASPRWLLTRKDALLLAVWLAINAVWLALILQRSITAVQSRAQKGGLSDASWVKVIAKALAGLLAPNMVLLFFPVSRSSVVLQAFGLGYAEGIRYHRAIGNFVMLLVLLHGGMYWSSWLYEGRWLASALRQGNDTNNLLGGICFCCAMVMWATSVEAVRRSRWPVFKALHWAGFGVFILAGAAHHWPLFFSFVPCLVLWAVDGAVRLHHQLATPSVVVLRAEASPGGGMCSLLLAPPAGFALPAAAGTVWLNAPELSWLGWHPFDCVAAAHGDGLACLVHIKAYDRWTRALVARVAAGKPLAIKLQGPVSHPPGPTARPDAAIIVAGGNGAAAVLALCAELAGLRGRPSLPTLLIWSSRHGEEFTFMGPRVMAALHALGVTGELTTHLSITGTHAAPSTASKPLAPPEPAAAAKQASATDHAVTEDAAAAGSCPSSLCPVLAFTHAASQASFKLVLHMAVLAGAAAGFLLANHIAFQLPEVAGRPPLATKYTGVLLVALTGAGAVFAGLVTLWGGLFLRGCRTGGAAAAWCRSLTGTAERSRSVAAMGGAAQQPADAPCKGSSCHDRAPGSAAAAMAGRYGQLQLAAGGDSGAVGGSSRAAPMLLRLPSHGGGELCLPVAAGRQPLGRLVAGWLAGLQQLPALGKAPLCCTVFACGPATLVEDVQQLVGTLSAQGCGAALCFVAKTHAL